MLEKILTAILMILTIRIWINTSNQHNIDVKSPFYGHEKTIARNLFLNSRVVPPQKGHTSPPYKLD